MYTELDLAYCAGLFDGEAYIGITKNKPYHGLTGRVTPGYHAKIQCRMTDEQALDFISKLFGGFYWKEKPNAHKGRPLYCYQLSDAAAECVIRLLLPFLKVKRSTAEIALALRDLQKDGWLHRTKVVGYRNFPNRHGTPRQVENRTFSDEYVNACECLWLECKRLNKVGIDGRDLSL